MNAAVCRCIGIDACVTLVHLTNNNIMETATRLLIKDIMDRRIVSAPCSASTNSNSCGLWVTHCLSFVVFDCEFKNQTVCGITCAAPLPRRYVQKSRSDIGAHVHLRTILHNLSSSKNQLLILLLVYGIPSIVKQIY